MPQIAFDLNLKGSKNKNKEKWSTQDVKIILSNRLNIGEYSVAGYNENIHELQIIENHLYEEVQKISHRYKIAGTPKRVCL